MRLTSGSERGEAREGFPLLDSRYARCDMPTPSWASPVTDDQCGRCSRLWITGEPDEFIRFTSGVRREARHHIPGAAGRHSKEVFGLPAYQRSKGQRDRSMLGEGRNCGKTLYRRLRSTRPTW